MDFGRKIDITVTQRGRLVLHANGASQDDSLVIRRAGQCVEIVDTTGTIAKAEAIPAAFSTLRRFRSADVVLIDPAGEKRLHEGVIRKE
jgi:hypothetical protein